jgi:tetratricopeptide (TPR) repeat protein
VRSVSEDKASVARVADVLNQADPDAWRRRMREALTRNDLSALKSLATTAELDGQPAATLTFLYAALSAAGSADVERELVLRRAQWKYPGDYWINHRLGVDLIWRNQPQFVQEGIGYMRAAVALRPQGSHAIMNLGNGYRFLGERDSAAACYRKAIELNPREWSAYSNLAETLNELGRHDEGIALLEQAIGVVPCGAAYAQLSLNHSVHPDLHRRDANAALQLAEKAIELEPAVGNHWTAVGLARYRQGQWQPALADLEKARQLPTQQRWDEAIDWFSLAMCYGQLGQRDAARQSFEKGDAWMKSNAPDDERLIRLRAEAGALLGLAAQRDSRPGK